MNTTGPGYRVIGASHQTKIVTLATPLSTLRIVHFAGVLLDPIGSSTKSYPQSQRSAASGFTTSHSGHSFIAKNIFEKAVPKQCFHLISRCREVHTTFTSLESSRPSTCIGSLQGVMILILGGVMKALALGVALLVASTVLAKAHEWKTCKIISQNMSSDDGGTAVVPIVGMIAAVPIRRYSNTVVMEANGYRMTLVEKQNKHYLILAENSSAQFYQDEKWFVFLDMAKKEHKFSLVHLEKL
jgi:hypothetical protein